MTGVKVRELNRDDELGLVNKKISFPDGSSFETPTKSIKHIKRDEFVDKSLLVNEISKNINEDTVRSVSEGRSQNIVRGIRNRFKTDKLNVVIPSFKFDRVPDPRDISNLSQLIYSSSSNNIFLPAVKTGLLKDDRKITNKKVQKYFGMMKSIVEEIRNVGNRKVIIGTIPLMAPKYSRPLIDIYYSLGISSFCIDAGNKDILGNETEFRIILSKINEYYILNETLIYLSNAGYPQFQKEETRADDFLGMFAYVDILGGTFKSKVITNKTPRTKVFSKKNYCYRIFQPKSQEAMRLLGINNLIGANLNTLKNYNQSEQLRETLAVKKITGEDKIMNYLKTKKAVDNISLTRLVSISNSIRRS